MVRAGLRVLVLGAAVAAAAGALVVEAPAAHAGHIEAPPGPFTPEYVGEINGIFGSMAHNGTHIFATDYENDRVQILDASGNPAGTIGSAGAGLGHFDDLRDITLNSTHVFVLDSGNGRVQIFDMAGNYAGVLGSAGPGLFTSDGIALNSTHVFVVGGGAGARVQIFDMAGNYAGEFEHLFYPTSIAHTGTHLIVVDRLFKSTLILDASGNQVKRLPVDFSSGGVAANPTHIFVSDFSNHHHRIQIFDASGNYAGTLGKRGDGPGEFLNIDRIALNSTHVFVVGDARIQIFALPEQHVLAPATATPPPPPTGILSLSYGYGTMQVLDAGDLMLGTLGRTVDISANSTHLMVADSISGRTFTFVLPGN